MCYIVKLTYLSYHHICYVLKILTNMGSGRRYPYRYKLNFYYISRGTAYNSIVETLITVSASEFVCSASNSGITVRIWFPYQTFTSVLPKNIRVVPFKGIRAGTYRTLDFRFLGDKVHQKMKLKCVVESGTRTYYVCWFGLSQRLLRE